MTATWPRWARLSGRYRINSKAQRRSRPGRAAPGRAGRPVPGTMPAPVYVEGTVAIRTSAQQNRAAARAANAGRRKRRRRGRRTLHYMLLLIVLLATGAILSFTVLFKIEAVTVIGADKYTPDEIVEASGVVLEENLLRIDKAGIRRNLLERFPYIAEVEVRRKLPPSVEITVIQAEPAGAILENGEVALISWEGKVLERGVILIPDDVPVIKGIDAAGARPGDLLGAYTSPKLATGEEMTKEQRAEEERVKGVQERLTMFHYLMEAMGQTEFTNLTNVDLTDRLNIQIMYENRILLELGSEAQLADKLRRVKYILENNIGAEESGTLNAADITRRWVVFRAAPVGGVEQAEVAVEAPLPEELRESAQE